MNDKKINSEDQINLGAFRHFVIGLFRIFFGLLSFTVFTIKKHKWLLIGGFLLGAGIGTYYFYSRKSSYKATMIVQFNKLTKQTYAEILDHLNLLTKPYAGNKLATELNISESQAKNISSFESTTMNNVLLKKDSSTKINQPFKIIVSLHNNTNTDSLQNAILNFINNRPYLKSIASIERKNYQERLEFINRELKKIDTLKTEFNKSIGNSRLPSTVYNSAVNPADIYVYTNSLVLEKETTQKLLALENNALMLIDSFKISKSPESKSFSFIVLIAGCLGLFLTLLLSLLIETEKKVVPR